MNSCLLSNFVARTSFLSDKSEEKALFFSRRFLSHLCSLSGLDKHQLDIGNSMNHASSVNTQLGFFKRIEYVNGILNVATKLSNGLITNPIDVK